MVEEGGQEGVASGLEATRSETLAVCGSLDEQRHLLLASQRRGVSLEQSSSMYWYLEADKSLWWRLHFRVFTV